MSKVPQERPGKTVCLIQVGKRWVIGENAPKTSPKLRRTFPDGQSTYGTHAEDRALQLASRSGGKIRRVIVLRWTKRGTLSMARPCRHCEARLRLAGVKMRDLWYSDWNGEVVWYG